MLSPVVHLHISLTVFSFKNFSKPSFEDDFSCVPWSILDVFDVDPDNNVEDFNPFVY